MTGVEQPKALQLSQQIDIAVREIAQPHLLGGCSQLLTSLFVEVKRKHDGCHNGQHDESKKQNRNEFDHVRLRGEEVVRKFVERRVEISVGRLGDRVVSLKPRLALDDEGHR